MMKKIFLNFFLLLPFCLLSQLKFDQKPTIEAAQSLLASLSEAQKARGHFDFKDSSRTRWSNLPAELYTRRGLRLDSLDDAQKMHLHALLRSVLSTEGYHKVLFVIQFDEMTKGRLSEAQNPIHTRYGQEKYWLSIFGEPGAGQVWGWKFEGHHLSLNFTHKPSGVSCTPMFIGINPALTTSGPFAGRYLMCRENELGKELFASLAPDLRKQARLGEHPTDADPMAQTGQEPFLKNPAGLSFQAMRKTQQKLALDCIRAWAGNLAPELAAEKMAKVERRKRDIRFAWLGSDDAEALHYFRLHAPGCTVELTNRDGGLQHLHGLWRMLDEDFGR